MTTTHVDTFEHDIAEEIRHKEASITDIASAVGDIGNTSTEDEPKKNPLTIIVILVVLLFVIIGISYAGYTYYTVSKKESEVLIKKEPVKNKSDISLSSLSPILDQHIGIYISDTQKTNKGYIATITSYPAVFSYMIRNEKDFVEEIATTLGNTKTLPVKATTTPNILTASTTFSSTTPSQNISTTSEEIPQTEYIFSDITVSNQNIRIAKTVYGDIAYAFVGTQKLIIASSVENLLALRGNTLTK